MKGLAWRNSQRFDTNIKAGHKFEQRHLEAKFGQPKFSEPHLWRGKQMYNVFLPNLNFFCPILSSYQKVMAVLMNHLRVRVSKVRYRLGWEIGWSNDDENFMVKVQRGCIKEKKAENKFCNLSRACNGCSGSVCYWIGGIRWAAQPNAQSGVLQTKNMNPN
jgi:hypothetical protein